MSFEEWELLPHQPGWKHEYRDGCAHLTPNHRTAATVAPVTPRPVNPVGTTRHVLLEDEAPLLTAYLEAFVDDQAFCHDTGEQFHDAAYRDLYESFHGRRDERLTPGRRTHPDQL
jgi:hypothetical protein